MIATRYWISLTALARSITFGSGAQRQLADQTVLSTAATERTMVKGLKRAADTPKADIGSIAAFGLKRETTSPAMTTELVNTQPLASV